VSDETSGSKGHYEKHLFSHFLVKRDKAIRGALIIWAFDEVPAYFRQAIDLAYVNLCFIV
jgi:hypothetical protein